MADETTNTQGKQPVMPNPDLKPLDRLVGTWVMSGDVSGTVRYEWMAGGFFLIQHVNLEAQDGQRIQGIEIIGHLHRYGEEPSRIFTPATTTAAQGRHLTTYTTWTGIH